MWSLIQVAMCPAKKKGGGFLLLKKERIDIRRDD